MAVVGAVSAPDSTVDQELVLLYHERHVLLGINRKGVATVGEKLRLAIVTSEINNLERVEQQLTAGTPRRSLA